MSHLASRRIAFVTNGNPIGGAETQLLRLAAHLRGAGDEVMVLSLLPNPRLVAGLLADGIPVSVAPVRSMLRGPSTVAWAASELRHWRPHAVVAFVYQSVIVARLAARLAGVPAVISSIRNEWIGGRGRERLVRLTDRLTAVTVVNSDLAGRALTSRAVLRPTRCHVVPNGIELAQHTRFDRERDELRRQWGVGDGRFLWLAAGRLVAQKDYATMVAAFARAARGRDTRLLIAGDGSLRDELERRVTMAGVGDRVDFLGHRDDVPALLAAADALVLSSRWEGLPNVVLEALASARPVVATAVGGVPELVEDGRTGWLVPAGDPATLATAMARLMDLPPVERDEMGTQARAAAGRFEWSAIASQWSDLIDEQLARTGRAAVV